MRPVLLTRASHLWQIVNTLDARGVPFHRIANRTGYTLPATEEPERPIAFRHAQALLAASAEELNAPDFGLLVGNRHPPKHWGHFGESICRALTVYDALVTGKQMASSYTSAAQYWLYESGKTLWFCGLARPGTEAEQQLFEQILLSRIIHVVRLGAGPDWTPQAAWVMAGQRPRLEETPMLAGTRVFYRAPITAIAIPRSLLPLPCFRSPIVPKDRQASAEESPGHDTLPTDFVVSIELLMETLLPDGNASLANIADAAGLSLRSLQRNLSRAGTTHRALLDRVRYRVAVDRLRDRGTKLTDVSFDLGYASAPHFSRAFRRWTGVSPSEYRQQQAL